MRDPWDDPAFRHMMREFQRRQNDPAYQYMMREAERQQNDPAYQHMVREMQRRQNDPVYQYMLKEMERRQKDPGYRALLESMESRRLNDYPELLRTIPDVSRMQDLLRAAQVDDALSRVKEFQDLTSRLGRQRIELLLDADRLRDHQAALRTVEEVIRAQEAYRDLDLDALLGQESVRFAPPLEAPPAGEVAPAENEQISAELFLLDVQAKIEDFQSELAEDEQLVVCVAFDGITMQVNTFYADTYNRIRLVGFIGGLESVVIVKQSDFKLIFMKRRLERERPKRRIGFILEDEIVGEEDEDEN